MDILDIIDKKEKGEKLTKEELQYTIDNYLNGTIKDYQMSAFLTEIDLLGLSDEETINLTDIMLKSGETLDLGFDNIVDKHSTGGVGDKTTIVLAPLVASLGVKVAKMSGRGLGHTGGTIDKLDSIEGFKTSMTLEKFKKQVSDINIALVGQMGNLVPADKKIYALRDVTGTVDSIPLIASSIMSKKLASGASSIVIDLKVGSGALVSSLDEAKELASTMVKIGKCYNKKIACILTNMDEPLGYAVGNSLEVIEAINFLKGDMPKDLKEVVLELGANMIQLAGVGNNIEENKEMMLEKIQNGDAFNKFKEMVQNQGGDVSYLDDIKKFKKSKYTVSVATKKTGIVKEINAEEIGKLACYLGSGRQKKEDKIEPEVGIVLNKKVGDFVEESDFLAYICANDENKTKEAVNKILEIYKIEK